ncbi:MAG: hypothetical protein E7432_08010 [Ruminococcaceae bacterium]|nr:hypothetical protein [Oscillospiraceae bacterium]
MCCLIYKVLLLFAVTFATAYLVYHTLSRLSSTFFKFFQTLFQHRLSRQLVYCITSAPLCQYLFSTFSRTFSSFFQLFFQHLPSPHRRQLLYIITTDLICQPPISTFFDFFILYPNVHIISP